MTNKPPERFFVLHMIDVVLALSSQWRLSYTFWGCGAVLSEAASGDEMSMDRYEGEPNSSGWEERFPQGLQGRLVLTLRAKRQRPYSKIVVGVYSVRGRMRIGRLRTGDLSLRQLDRPYAYEGIGSLTTVEYSIRRVN